MNSCMESKRWTICRFTIQETDFWSGDSVVVCGGISFNHNSPLITINCNLNAQCYIDEVVRPTVILFMAGHQYSNLFQQDNACADSARLTMTSININHFSLIWVQLNTNGSNWTRRKTTTAITNNAAPTWNCIAERMNNYSTTPYQTSGQANVTSL